MLAVAVPDASVSFTAVTVIVSTWFVPTRFEAVCGEIWMKASTQVLFALPQFELQPAVTLSADPVVRVSVPTVFPYPTLFRSWTDVVPAAAFVIVTVQVAVR